MKKQGTIARGIRAPLIKAGENIAQIAVDSVLAAAKEGNYQLNDKQEYHKKTSKN